MTSLWEIRKLWVTKKGKQKSKIVGRIVMHDFAFPIKSTAWISIRRIADVSGRYPHAGPPRSDPALRHFFISAPCMKQDTRYQAGEPLS